ncbi:MAG: CBS domain-containing protein [Methanophagales archaeon]|nr:CBS domain-containing protein [Methanophagales archaeon]
MKEKVEEIMTRDVITATENDTVLNVVNVLRANSIAGVPVVNDREEIVGVVSVSDILKLLDDFHWYTPFFSAMDILHLHSDELEDVKRDIEEVSEMKVKDAMSKNPKTIAPDTLIDDAAQIMYSTGFNRLPVLDEKGKLVGIVARADIITSLCDL